MIKRYKVHADRYGIISSVKDIPSHFWEAPEGDYWISLERYRMKLPANLRSRLKILTRELAAHQGYTYNLMRDIVHELYHPKKDVEIAGKVVEVTVATNDLTSDEARIIEASLYELGATLGCPLSIPQAKGE